MPETTTTAAFGRGGTFVRATSKRLRLLPPNPVRLEQGSNLLPPSASAATSMRFFVMEVEDSASRTRLLEELRHRMPLERTEALLERVLEAYDPSEIISWLRDGDSSAVLKARLLTLVPRLRGSVEDAILVTILSQLSRDADSEVRYVVADALADFESDESSRVLRSLADDPISTIRSIAEEALAERA